jgi:hypothetical protein
MRKGWDGVLIKASSNRAIQSAGKRHEIKRNRKRLDFDLSAWLSFRKLRSTRSMPEESTFFQNGNITVTNARFIVAAHTFAIRGVTSVEGVETPASYGGAALAILLGLIMSIAIFTGGYAIGIVGLVLLVIGIALAINRKSKFAVVLRTAGGEVTAYESPDRHLVAQIIRALNEAIIAGG